MLVVEDLVVAYGGIQALKGVSLRVERGEYVGVIGPNGAGKTTLLLALSGALPVRSGRIALDGEDLAGVPQHRRVSRGVAIVPEGREVFGPLSVRENLELGAYHRRRTSPRAEVRADLEMVLDLFPVLRQRTRQLAATLSGGEQQMLAVGRALMSRPRLLLLDEPSLGLAPVIAREIIDTLGRLHAEGLTCLLVEQDATLALGATARTYVFRTGVVVAEGSSAELRANPLVEEIYLGGEGVAPC
jgi:branched-chain amino acid transport system ATP-binding protein